VVARKHCQQEDHGQFGGGHTKPAQMDHRVNSEEGNEMKRALKESEIKLEKAKAELEKAEGKLEKAEGKLEKAEGKLEKAKLELKKAAQSCYPQEIDLAKSEIASTIKQRDTAQAGVTTAQAGVTTAQEVVTVLSKLAYPSQSSGKLVVAFCLLALNFRVGGCHCLDNLHSSF